MGQTHRRTVTLAGGLIALALAAAGCGGGGSGSPSSPSPAPGGGGGGTATAAATITIEANGRINPSSVTITQGGRVTIVNNHSRQHDMSSDPHPTHTECPEVNAVGFLAPGQSRTSGNFNTVRTCGFHDHDLPNDAGLQGRIVIVAAQ